MSKSLSYLFKKTIGWLKHKLSSAKFTVKDVLTQLKERNPAFDSFPKTINKDKQGKHIYGNKNYSPGRSVLSIGINEAQALINKYSGKGQMINGNKERVDFNTKIGIFIDNGTGKATSTTIGIIHYSKTGTHIVPAQPRK